VVAGKETMEKVVDSVVVGKEMVEDLAVVV
jgi:hypothetical protein